MSPIYQAEPNLPNLKVDVACFSATLVSNYRTTQYHHQEDH